MIDEERIDQVGNRETRFTDQVAEPRMTAEAPWPMKRITGCGLEGHHAIPMQRRRGGRAGLGCHGQSIDRAASNQRLAPGLTRRAAIESG